MRRLTAGIGARSIILGLALLSVGLLVAACGPATPGRTGAGTPTPAKAIAATNTPAKPAGNPPATQPAGKKTKLPVGVDAQGNFYRGDPKAPVKFVDFSDFQ